MPKLFTVSGYIVYFWSNEEGEPIHVHVSKGRLSFSLFVQDGNSFLLQIRLNFIVDRTSGTDKKPQYLSRWKG